MLQQVKVIVLVVTRDVTFVSRNREEKELLRVPVRLRVCIRTSLHKNKSHVPRMVDLTDGARGSIV